ncbi:PAS domain-containing protein [Phenylobacterium sp. J426]|uniref:sensor histidine kinase n=1 Tax=Phenylobacterium sp. J426 TaxID=2898439 RepID=UPI002150AECF|nr:HWE histidine kinase domain-containing protein [Phenylobacterium sp. J426]MCR5874627.1 PAS domain-containing protein [Phenylobacterium sp. J426]
MHAIDDVAPGAVAAPDFRALFERLPSPYMILDRELRYVEANAVYCEILEREREDLIGRNIFDAFPDNGESGRRLRASFERVLATGQPDSLPLIPYPIERPASRGGGFEMRYWSAVHVPLVSADGCTDFIVQNTVDVTELQRLKEMAYGPGGRSAPAPGETDLFQRAQEAEALNQTLMQESQGLRDLFMQAPGFMAVLTGEDLTFALVNNAYQQLIGHRKVIGLPIDSALPEVRAQGFVTLLEQVMRTREPHVGQATSVRLQRAPGAPLEERFVDFVFQPIVAPSGEAWGVFVEGSDVTSRVLAERQQKLLVDELNHRVKNTLATVQAIAAQTLRSADDLETFRIAFESRLMALSATHDLLTATSWRSAKLRDVLGVEFKPYGPERYRLQGPDVALSPAEALALGLLFHELATNAAKYGALSTSAGCIEVDWAVGAKSLELSWRERGGPTVAPPQRRGFGSRLIERSLKGALGGEAVLDFSPEGLVCRINLPLSEAH